MLLLPVTVKVKVKGYHRGHSGAAHRGHGGIRFRRAWFLHSRWYQNFLGNFFVDCFDVVVAISVVEDADNGRMRARERSNNAAVGPSIVAHVGDFDDDA